MNKTENLYAELKNKIQDLVGFMAEYNLDSTEIKVEFNENFTFCNVNYKNNGLSKDEFLYLFDKKEDLVKKSQLEVAVSNIVETNENVTSNNNLNDSTKNSTIKAEKTKDSVKNVSNNDLAPLSIKEEALSAKNKSVDTSKTIDKSTVNDNSDKNKEDNKQPQKKSKNINLKEEYLWQKDYITNILKENKLI